MSKANDTARKPWAKRPDAPQRLHGRAGVERRARWMRENPLCVKCLAMTPRRLTAGTDLDHVVALAAGGVDDGSNFQTLCRTCHTKKSLADKGYRYRPSIGLDGYALP